MKKVILSLLIVFAASLIFTNANAQVKQKKVIKASIQNYVKSRGADENIKSARPTVDTPAVKPAKSRGDECQINLCNNTSYAVDIFIDGVWQISIPAFCCYNKASYSGKVKIYGKSLGGTKFWGPNEVDCENEYSWELSE